MTPTFSSGNEFIEQLAYEFVGIQSVFDGCEADTKKPTLVGAPTVWVDDFMPYIGSYKQSGPCSRVIYECGLKPMAIFLMAVI